MDEEMASKTEENEAAARESVRIQGIDTGR